MLVHLYERGSGYRRTACGKPKMAESHECVLASRKSLRMLPSSMTACPECLAADPPPGKLEEEG
jgi:hypothetical protein